MGSTATAWVLTAIFAASGGYCLALVAWPGTGPAPRITSGWHLLMCLWMIAMSWQWGMAVPTWVTVTVFCAGTLWFVFVGTGGWRSPRRPAGAAIYHAAMMAAMIPMALLMRPARHSAGMADMSVMTAGHGGSGEHRIPAGTDSLQWLSTILAGLFLLAMLWQLLFLARWLLSADPPKGPVLARMSAAVMAAGMALACYQLAP